MKHACSLLVAAVLATASLAHGDNKPAGPSAPSAAIPSTPPTAKPGASLAATAVITVSAMDYDCSGRSLLGDPALLKEIDDTLIKAGACRTMAAIGYGNGYQCPPAGLTACMTMLKAGKVDACAALTGRDYPTGCGAKEATSAEVRAASTCSDLSADLWKTLTIKAPYAAVKQRLEDFGCKAETGTTMFCPSHIREWLCQPFERGGVVVCRPPTIVKQCSGGEFPSCQSVET